MCVLHQGRNRLRSDSASKVPARAGLYRRGVCIPRQSSLAPTRRQPYEPLPNLCLNLLMGPVEYHDETGQLCQMYEADAEDKEE